MEADIFGRSIENEEYSSLAFRKWIYITASVY